MDQTATPKKRREVSEATWTDSAARLVKQFLQEPYLKVVHINTPMGFDARVEKVYKHENLRKVEKLPENVFKSYMPLTVFVRMCKHRGPTFGLEQRLPGKVDQDATVLKKHKYTYNWYKDREGVVIRQNLNTLKAKYLEQLAEELLKEAQLFHFSYIRKDELTPTIKEEEFPLDAAF